MITTRLCYDHDQLTREIEKITISKKVLIKGNNLLYTKEEQLMMETSSKDQDHKYIEPIFAGII